jgi:hypothetical protein
MTDKEKIEDLVLKIEELEDRIIQLENDRELEKTENYFCGFDSYNFFFLLFMLFLIFSISGFLTTINEHNKNINIDINPLVPTFYEPIL